METGAVVERIGRIDATRVAVGSGLAVVSDIQAGLCDIGSVRAHLDRAEAELVTALKPAVSFPESTIADTTRGSLGDATKTIDRANTLADTPNLADALGDAAHHHGKVHHEGWRLDLGPNRELTIRHPDGTIRTTGPPSRQTAA